MKPVFVCRHWTATGDGGDLAQPSLSNSVGGPRKGNHHEETSGNPVHSALYGPFRDPVLRHQQDWSVDQCGLLETEGAKVSHLLMSFNINHNNNRVLINVRKLGKIIMQLLTGALKSGHLIFSWLNKLSYRKSSENWHLICIVNYFIILFERSPD